MSAFSNVTAGGAQQLRLLHTGLSNPYCLDSTPLLERQQQQESNARSYPRRIPLVLERAHGIYVQDSRGQVFVDCLAGAGTSRWATTTR